MSELRQCWAANADFGRCTLDAGHLSEHEVRNVWGDEDCVDVEELIATSAKADEDYKPYGVVPFNAPPVPERAHTDEEFVMGCGACGCSKDAHDVDLGDETGCVKHQCRRYV
jgi:hypothetical protein